MMPMKHGSHILRQFFQKKSLFLMRKWRKTAIHRLQQRINKANAPHVVLFFFCKKQFQTQGYISVQFLDPTFIRSGQRAADNSPHPLPPPLGWGMELGYFTFILRKIRDFESSVEELIEVRLFYKMVQL